MRTLPNKKLTANISLWEVIGGATVPKKGNELAWKHINEFDEVAMKAICNRVQKVRDIINKEFRVKNGGKEITLIVGSGFRPRVWELIRGRSGGSRHVLSDALDITPGNCSPELAIEILQWLHTKYSPRVGGWQGGFAIKWPTFEKGKLKAIGFAHFDNRPAIVRWTY